MCRSPLNALHLLLTLWDDTYGCHQMLRKCATHNMNDSCAGVRKKRKKKQFPLLRELAKSSRIVYILLTEWAKTDFGRFPLFARQLPTACFSPCLFTFPVVKSLWKYCWWDWVDSWCPYLKQHKNYLCCQAGTWEMYCKLGCLWAPEGPFSMLFFVASISLSPQWDFSTGIALQFPHLFTPMKVQGVRIELDKRFFIKYVN